MKTFQPKPLADSPKEKPKVDLKPVKKILSPKPQEKKSPYFITESGKPYYD